MSVSPVIQIVEDDEAVRTALQFALQAVGFNASSYFDAKDFLERGQCERGILICDVRMPGMNGIELANLLRERGSNMSIILTTGNASRALEEEAVSAGVAAIFEKPVGLATIFAEIRRLGG
ncbi:response regulator [Sphingomonas sp. RB3P16]|uniref:response regulator n=1 Tax=Parasphingomonas frigoris TaxID=3096163 RepID=UPI002FC5BDD2